MQMGMLAGTNAHTLQPGDASGAARVPPVAQNNAGVKHCMSLPSLRNYSTDRTSQAAGQDIASGPEGCGDRLAGVRVEYGVEAGARLPQLGVVGGALGALLLEPLQRILIGLEAWGRRGDHQRGGRGRRGVQCDKFALLSEMEESVFLWNLRCDAGILKQSNSFRGIRSFVLRCMHSRVDECPPRGGPEWRAMTEAGRKVAP